MAATDSLVVETPARRNDFAASDKTTSPLGVGKLFRSARPPVNGSVQAYDHAVKPDVGPDWSTRVQVQLLFPR